MNQRHVKSSASLGWSFFSKCSIFLEKMKDALWLVPEDFYPVFSFEPLQIFLHKIPKLLKYRLVSDAGYATLCTKEAWIVRKGKALVSQNQVCCRRSALFFRRLRSNWQ